MSCFGFVLGGRDAKRMSSQQIGICLKLLKNVRLKQRKTLEIKEERFTDAFNCRSRMIRKLYTPQIIEDV